MAHLERDLERLERAAEICKEQGKVLVEAFRRVEFDSRDRVEHEVIQGVNLLASCRVNGWIVRTLLRAESRLEFREIHRFLTADGDGLNELMEAAQQDRSDLLQMTRRHVDVVSSPNSNESCALHLVRSLLQEDELCYTDEGLPIGFLIDKQFFPRTKPKFIASGNNGAVYSVKWLDHEFAIKTIRGGSPSYRQEVKVLRLKHPNVLSVIGYYYNEVDMSYSIVMEKMATSLQLLLHKMMKENRLTQWFQSRGRSPFKEPIAVLLMLQIAKGVEFLHSEGLLHLDIKPANILVADASCEPNKLVVKIGDYGSSRLVRDIEPEEVRNPKEGTCGYRAPDLRYTKKLDIFSYAMTCYEILSGKNEFKKDDRMLQAGLAQPPLPSDCHPQLQSLLTRCWSHVPDERPPFSSIVRELIIIRNGRS